MATYKSIQCPQCGHQWKSYHNPLPTVDAIIEYDGQIVLIQRKNPPYGLALPGGFVDYGESVETAVVREAREETQLHCQIVHLLGVYSDPLRDPRHHSITTAFVLKGTGLPKAMDDAASISLFSSDTPPQNMVFDHAKILKDYLAWKRQIQPDT